MWLKYTLFAVTFFLLGYFIPKGIANPYRLKRNYSIIICFFCSFILTVCLYSIWFEHDKDLETTLLGMTDLQQYVLILVACCDILELGFAANNIYFIGNFYETELIAPAKDELLWHHTLSLVGIVYQIHYKVGGGIMMRLLLGSNFI